MVSPSCPSHFSWSTAACWLLFWVWDLSCSWKNDSVRALIEPAERISKVRLLSRERTLYEMSVTCHSWLTRHLWGLVLAAGITIFMLLHDEALHSLAATSFWLLCVTYYPCPWLYKCNRILCILSNIIFWCVLFRPSHVAHLFYISVLIWSLFFPLVSYFISEVHSFNLCYIFGSVLYAGLFPTLSVPCSIHIWKMNQVSSGLTDHFSPLFTHILVSLCWLNEASAADVTLLAQQVSLLRLRHLSISYLWKPVR